MPGFDERLKRGLERLVPPADPAGAFDRVLEKKIRRRVMRRFQAATLAFAVAAGTVGGSIALYQAFRSEKVSTPSARLPASGPILVIQSRSHRAGGVGFSLVEDTLVLLRPDGSIRETILEGKRGSAYSYPAWSPDGSRLLLQVQEGCCVPPVLGAYRMQLLRADGTLIREFATCNPGEGGCLGPAAWSPDGSRIAVIDGHDVVVMRPDGTERTTMAICRIPMGRPPNACSFIDGAPTWSPDGTRIAFARETIEGTGSVYVMQANGTGLKRITWCDSRLCHGGARDANAAWSPDGRWIAFDREFDIWLVHPDGGGLRNLTECHAPRQEGCASERPVWSPDGQRLLFERRDGIYVMKADGTGVKRLIANEPRKGISYRMAAWQPALSPSPTVSPEPSPTPTSSASDLPAECDPSQVTGNFDGDGTPDTATVAKTACFPSETGSASSTTEYSLQVQWAPSEGIVPLPECRKACEAVAATDLNGDGIDELILQIDAGASTDFFQVYELPASEAFGRPAIVAPPGSSRWPPGQPAEFSLFGSVLHFSALGCDLVTHRVIAKEVGVNDAQTRYLIHESVLRFEPIEAPPFGRFTVVSERDYTEPYDSWVGPGDRFEPGDPCWTYGS